MGSVSDTFEKPFRQHPLKLLILRGGICRSEGSEYIRFLKALSLGASICGRCKSTPVRATEAATH
jgi:hypothetical protein